MTQNQSKLSCASIAVILSLLIAVVALLFGDNIYQQIMGRSIFGSINSTAQPQLPVSTLTMAPGQVSAQTSSRLELDAKLGNNNWFCFPDRENAVGVKRLSANFVVQTPVIQIDTWQGTYKTGQTATGLVGATAWLENLLPKDQCPDTQREPLRIWMEARAADRLPLTRARIDSVLGTGNWECLPDNDYAFKIKEVPANIVVAYPLATIDRGDSTRYGVGETVPGGGRGTAWFVGNLSQQNCP